MNPFRFATKYYDEETKLVYHNARYYSPELGRFIGRDPIGESGGRNLYAYTGNNPANDFDVLGFASYSDSFWYNPNRYGVTSSGNWTFSQGGGSGGYFGGYAFGGFGGFGIIGGGPTSAQWSAMQASMQQAQVNQQFQTSSRRVALRRARIAGLILRRLVERREAANPSRRCNRAIRSVCQTYPHSGNLFR